MCGHFCENLSRFFISYRYLHLIQTQEVFGRDEKYFLRQIHTITTTFPPIPKRNSPNPSLPMHFGTAFTEVTSTIWIMTSQICWNCGYFPDSLAIRWECVATQQQSLAISHFTLSNLSVYSLNTEEAMV